MANVSPITGVLLARDKATLKELETYYSYEDALDIMEVIRVQSYNEWAAMEESKHGNSY